MGKKELLLFLLALGLVCGSPGCKELPIIDRDNDGVASKDDCNDLEATVYPGAPEYCDGLDNNCDGKTDTADALDVPSWFLDADGDGFGDPTTEIVTCYQPGGRINPGADCDDTRALVYPGAVELCDGLDTDCNPETEDEGRVSWTDGLQTEDLTGFFTQGTSNEPAVYLAEKPGELQICGGSYFALIEVRTDFNITGAGAPEMSTLNGGLLGTVIRVIAPATVVKIQGLTLKSGAATEEDETRAPYGGGISCEGPLNLSIIDCVIRDSTAQDGGGLGNQGCDITVENTSFLENQAFHKGGGVYQEDGTLHFQSVKSTANTAHLDGGGLHVDAGTATIMGSEFLLNESKRGGAISMSTGNLHLEGTLVRENEASVGGGILLEGFLGAADATLVGTVVRQNEAFSGGGMVLTYNSGATCTGAPESMGGFVQNEASEGGGILVLDSTRNLVFESEHCTFGSTDLDEENTPNDLEFFGGKSYSGFGVDANVVCTTTSCSDSDL